MRLMTIIALILVLSGAAIDAQQPDLPCFAAQGPYTVGAREFRIDDPERPLTVTIWYPAAIPESPAEPATYTLGLISTQGTAIANAEPDTEHSPYPLVVFSHGSGLYRFQSLFFTEHLASYGFVVMSADHPGNTLMDTLLGDRFVQSITPNYVYRPGDVLREIDYAETLTASNGPLAGMIDLERIAITGHSFGGYTALAAGGARLDFDALNQWCDDDSNAALDPYPDAPLMPSPTLPEVTYGSCFLRSQADRIAELREMPETPTGPFPATTDPRIQAVIALAPWNAPAFGPEGLASLTVPALIMVGTRDHITPPERDAYLVYDWMGSSHKSLVVFEGADHLIFVGDCPPSLVALHQDWICSDSAWDMDQAHDLINHFATAFLLATLYDDPAAHEALAEDFDGITYSTTW